MVFSLEIFIAFRNAHIYYIGYNIFDDPQNEIFMMNKPDEITLNVIYKYVTGDKYFKLKYPSYIRGRQ